MSVNFFDPNTLNLAWSGYDPLGSESFVGFNQTFSGGQPSNYASAIENSLDGTPGPFSRGFDLNWEGTFSVSPTNSVPEPAGLTMFSLGAVGLVAGAIRRRRQTKAAV